MRIIATADYTSPESLNRLSANDREYFYNGIDCTVTFELFNTLLAELDQISAKTYHRSLELRGPILEMSLRGIRVNNTQRAAVIREKEAIHARIFRNFTRLVKEGCQTELNYRSPTDLNRFFYEELRLTPIRKRNAKGQMVPTVNRDALEKLQKHFWAEPLCLHIIALRELDKQLSFLRFGVDPDGRIRSSFNIAGTKTGRLASSISEFGTGTNLQNIDRLLRTIFIPDPGMKFINIDLEQGDSRNMGALMWEIFFKEAGPAFAGSYLDACESGDLHTKVAQMTWPKLGWTDDPKENKKIAEAIFYRQDSYRQTSKKLGHGTNYMGQPPTMALHTKMPVSIIADFQRDYFSGFPVIPMYHRWIGNQLREYRNLITLHGRRRFFFGRPDEKTTLNEAVAYPSQSMTADAVNIAMINLFRSQLPVQILCQVHDSLLLQAPQEQVDELVPAVLECTRAPLILAGDRPFVVPNEAKIGWNWGDTGYGKDGQIVENAQGLIKWKASGDTRHPPKPARFSLDDVID